MRISQKAYDLIVGEENCDRAYYTQRCRGFEWPGGASGATVGIGYDLGYNSVDSIRNDWHGVLETSAIEVLCKASYIRGLRAAGFVSQNRKRVDISWEQALKVFSEHTVPKWEAITSAMLPNTTLLSGDSFGALVSLTYNRGPSYDLVGARYAEMRQLKAHMATGQFKEIPDTIVSMRRLWPKGGALWKRRGREADLFEAGLSKTNEVETSATS